MQVHAPILYGQPRLSDYVYKKKRGRQYTPLLRLAVLWKELHNHATLYLTKYRLLKLILDSSKNYNGQLCSENRRLYTSADS